MDTRDHQAARLVALHRRLNDLDPDDPRFILAAEALAVESCDALNAWLYTRSQDGERVATLHVASVADDHRPRAGLWLDDLTPEAANERLRSGDRGVFDAAVWPETRARALRNLLLAATAARWHEGTSAASAPAQLAIQALAYEPHRRAVDPPRRHPALVAGNATQPDRLREHLIRESIEGEYASGRGAAPVWSEGRLERVLALADEMPEPELNGRRRA